MASVNLTQRRYQVTPSWWLASGSGWSALRRCTMSILIDEKREEIAAACQRYGIERLFVFGSALRDDFRPGESDIDLLVEFGPLEITKRFHVYPDARDAFRRIFRCEVDLVMSGAVKNKVIAGEIDRTKKLGITVGSVLSGLPSSVNSSLLVRLFEESVLSMSGCSFPSPTLVRSLTSETCSLMTTEPLMTTRSSALSAQI